SIGEPARPVERVSGRFSRQLTRSHGTKATSGQPRSVQRVSAPTFAAAARCCPPLRQAAAVLWVPSSRPRGLEQARLLVSFVNRSVRGQHQFGTVPRTYPRTVHGTLSSNPSLPARRLTSSSGTSLDQKPSVVGSETTYPAPMPKLPIW